MSGPWEQLPTDIKSRLSQEGVKDGNALSKYMKYTPAGADPVSRVKEAFGLNLSQATTVVDLFYEAAVDQVVTQMLAAGAVLGVLLNGVHCVLFFLDSVAPLRANEAPRQPARLRCAVIMHNGSDPTVFEALDVFFKCAQALPRSTVSDIIEWRNLRAAGEKAASAHSTSNSTHGAAALASESIHGGLPPSDPGSVYRACTQSCNRRAACLTVVPSLDASSERTASSGAPRSLMDDPSPLFAWPLDLAGYARVAMVGTGRNYGTMKYANAEGHLIILKRAHSPQTMRELANEVRAYEKLRDLWGSAVPHMLGTGYEPGDELERPSLALSYVGDRIASGLDKATWHGLRQTILALYEAVWSRGVVQGDPARRNIVLGNGTVTLVDFGFAIVNASADDILRERQRVARMLDEQEC